MARLPAHTFLDSPHPYFARCLTLHATRPDPLYVPVFVL